MYTCTSNSHDEGIWNLTMYTGHIVSYLPVLVGTNRSRRLSGYDEWLDRLMVHSTQK